MCGVRACVPASVCVYMCVYVSVCLCAQLWSNRLKILLTGYVHLHIYKFCENSCLSTNPYILKLILRFCTCSLHIISFSDEYPDILERIELRITTVIFIFEVFIQNICSYFWVQYFIN